MGTTIGGSAPYAGPNKILLKTREWQEDAEVAAVFKPGHILMEDDDGKIKKHNNAGGVSDRMIAIENGLIGGTIYDPSVVGEHHPYARCEPNDEVYARVPIGEVVERGDNLVSDGAGCLEVYAGEGSHTLFASSAASADVTNTTTETAFATNQYTIPANFLTAGDVIHVSGQVVVSNNNSSDTLTLKLKIGSTVVAATAAVDVANNDIGFFDADIIVRDIGVTGHITASGTQGLGVPGTVTAKPFVLASTVINTTASQLVAITATWSVAHVNNVAALQQFTVETARVAYEQIMCKAMEDCNNSAGSDEAFCRVRFM